MCLGQMRNLYLLVSDGTRGLFLDSKGQVSLPCKTHWPHMRKPPKSWATPLLQHVTYGLFSLDFTRHPRPFGLPKDAAFKSATVDSQTLDDMLRALLNVRRWHHHHASYECPWRPKLFDLTTTVSDLPSCHCLRAYLSSMTQEASLPDEGETGAHLGAPAHSD
jgi:hypothetical protein